MASVFDIEAAAFFAHLFRATVSAAARATGGEGRPPVVFSPILIGLLGRAQPDDGAPPPPDDRILLVDPISRGVTVLRGDAAVLAEMLSAGSGRKGPPPASRVSIEAMRTVESVDVGEECAVCLDELRPAAGVTDKVEEAKARGEVREMPCRHRFHGGCIERWLGMHGTCPVCRFCMPAEDVAAKKAAGGDGVGADEEVERAIWFEVSFGRGETGDQETQGRGEAEERTM